MLTLAGADAGAGDADADDALRELRCSWDGDVGLVLGRLAVQKWVVCHVRGHKSAQFLVCTHWAVHVEVGMVRGRFEGLEVASDLLPRPVLPLGLPAMYAPEHELVVACSGWRYLCPILSEEETALGVTETLFCEPREATGIVLAEH